MITLVAAVQLAAGTNVRANLVEAEQQIRHAAESGAKLVVLPENFAFMGMNDHELLDVAETMGSGVIQDFLCQQAQQHGLWIIAGTVPLKSEQQDKVYAALLVYNDKGECIQRYDKIHLFDVTLADGNETYHESEVVLPGQKPVVVETPFARIGLAICYDLRFPELFRQLVNMGAEILVVPSAFTAVTGAAHWEVLLRARAIENLCYVVAADQGGYHVNGRETHGHSMIIDPWGVVLQQQPQGTGCVIAEIDLQAVHNIRQTFPALAHRKIACALA